MAEDAPPTLADALKESLRAASETPGQTAYEAYREASGGKSLVSGRSIPPWPALSKEIQITWDIAAEAVLKTWKSED